MNRSDALGNDRPGEETFFEAVLALDFEAVRASLDAELALVGAVAPENLVPVVMGRGRAGNTALHLAAFVGSEPLEILLCERGSNPAVLNAEGRTALHVALEHNNATCQKLVALGCPLDVCAAACLSRHQELTALLQKDPSLANDRTTLLSPLGWATYHGAKQSMVILLENGAKLDDGELLCAAGTGSVEMAAFLGQRGADVNEPRENGVTALHVAASHLYTDDVEPLVRWLLAHGADASARTQKGRNTALELTKNQEADQTQGGIQAGDPRYRNFHGVIAALTEQV